MNGFQAIVMICLSSTPREDCGDKTAVVYQSVHVNNELGCTSGWQEIIARGALRQSLTNDTYLKTACLRDKSEPDSEDK